MRRAGPTLAAAVVLLAVTADPAAAGEAVDTHSTVAPNQKAIDLIAQRTSDARQSEDHPSDGPLLREQVHGLICKGAIGGLATPLNGSCSEADAFTLDIDCGGDTPVQPLFSRVRTSESEPWSEWVPETIGGCPADVLPVLTVEDFRQLPLAPPVLTLQPDRGWVLGTTQWRDVVGTAETSATSAPFTVEERRSRLVSGLCTNVPRPDDCD